MADGLVLSSPDAVRAARALQQAPKRMAAAALRTHRATQPQVERWVRGSARTRQQRRMIGGVSARAGAALSVQIRNTAGAPGAVGAFQGGEARTGWYAASRYRNSSGRQRPAWVGEIQPGRRGGGPVADMLLDREAALADRYADEQVAAIVKPLPESRFR